MSILKLRALMNEPLLSNDDWQAIGSELELTGRELDVLRRMAKDEKESAIACRLGISSHTVHTHRTISMRNSA